MTGPQRLLETYIYLYQIIEWFNSSFITLLTMIIKSVSGNSNNPPEIVPSHVTVASSANLLFVRLVSIGCAHGEICKQSSHWRKKTMQRKTSSENTGQFHSKLNIDRHTIFTQCDIYTFI